MPSMLSNNVQTDKISMAAPDFLQRVFKTQNL